MEQPAKGLVYMHKAFFIEEGKAWRKEVKAGGLSSFLLVFFVNGALSADKFKNVVDIVDRIYLIMKQKIKSPQDVHKTSTKYPIVDIVDIVDVIVDVSLYL